MSTLIGLEIGRVIDAALATKLNRKQIWHDAEPQASRHGVDDRRQDDGSSVIGQKGGDNRTQDDDVEQKPAAAATGRSRGESGSPVEEPRHVRYSRNEHQAEEEEEEIPLGADRGQRRTDVNGSVTSISDAPVRADQASPIRRGRVTIAISVAAKMTAARATCISAG